MRKARLMRVNVTAQPQQLVPANENRIGLCFITSPAANFAVSTDPMANSNDGMLINTNEGLVELWDDKHGPIVKMAWNCWPSGVPAVCCYIEVLGP